MSVREIAEKAKRAQPQIAKASTDKKNKILQKIAQELWNRRDEIIQSNLKDIENAKKNGVGSAMIDRLKLDEKRIKGMIKSVEEVASLPDPVGKIVEMNRRPNGLIVGRMRIPLGVIGVIYEARPNVTVDIAALAIKSSNAVVLRGGSEAINSNLVLTKVIKDAISSEGISPEIIGFIEDTSRERIVEMIKLEDLLELVIPRGGESLIRFVTENSRVPVLKHFKGVCHVFVDEYADLEKAFKICLNAKVQRPSVCNAMETLLVHKNIAESFLPKMSEIYKEQNVELRGCEITRRYVKWAKPATEDDWYAEYLDLILAVRVVENIDEAIEHIKKYGSSHTDAIVTENYTNAMRFINEVDSSSVMVNASTRFSDGYEYGLGAEVGISTTKLHAYGPMGLEGLTALKWVVFGDGHIRT
ncbi:MAG: glutamate-5-semialdehyde dehydrogenase [Candidatus Calescibacterium sp.]|nr:glutamate-5-semialdehyde dehydrogenase [Candidatus Calescibacterium sp.]MCX7733318.1 glutamate-5-semialdehyde dehydrogenase [bacterium]MDW8086760.1 glutamate-5-semialdehyde dehydrogenase [Candidatus Calescibacterium sp.]